MSLASSVPPSVADATGLNLYADPTLARLVSLYLPHDLASHPPPHLDCQGAPAGSRLDTFAGITDENPPALHHGTRALGFFLLPRVLPDGSQNASGTARLQDKRATCSMASGESRLEGATAYPVEDLTAGFRQTAHMINNARPSNGVRATGLMHHPVTEAPYVARHRTALGHCLVALPLLRRQLAKFRVRAKQARTMVFQTAEVLRNADACGNAAYALLRIRTPDQVPRLLPCVRRQRRRNRGARRRWLCRGMARCTSAARRASRLNPGGHQQHRVARRAAPGARIDWRCSSAWCCATTSCHAIRLSLPIWMPTDSGRCCISPRRNGVRRNRPETQGRRICSPSRQGGIATRGRARIHCCGRACLPCLRGAAAARSTPGVSRLRHGEAADRRTGTGHESA